ncbi:MAG: glycosyltransferase [Desulfosudaceae bacterium]
MNIIMASNTYRPHVGGVANSVERFVRSYRKKGHAVLVIAPEHEGAPENEEGVFRLPALQNYNGSDFSVRLPLPSGLFARINRFKPDIVHSHHPFLIGDTALRVAARWDLPIVFTHHTRYERYTHYVPGDSRMLRRFSRQLATEYANLCHHVVAPTQSMARLIKQRGVDTPVSVVPTGLDVRRFARGDGDTFRRQYGIAPDEFVVGYVGRLAPEKNLSFLTVAVLGFLKKYPRTRFVVVGGGDSAVEIKRLFHKAGLADRLLMTGKLTGQSLIDSCQGMDLFVFASRTETQGLALAEVMAAGLPVIALKAAGTSDIVRHDENGYLVEKKKVKFFLAAMSRFMSLDASARKRLSQGARQTSRKYDQDQCAEKMLRLYRECLQYSRHPLVTRDSLWEKTLRQIEIEWSIISTKARAAGFSRLLVSHPPLVRLEQFRRWLRKLVSRAEWSTRLLNLVRRDVAPDEEGLVFIQIDGLSQEQYQRATQSGRLPFLRRLVKREAYAASSLYSGVPSTTPAFQGELFYGVKAVVPAFAYYHPDLGITGMLNPEAARSMERKMRHLAGGGLLEGGSCYSDIYRGDAVETHFCPAAAGWQQLISNTHPVRVALTLIWHGFTVVRALALSFLEVLLAVIDCVQGGIQGQNLIQEIKFIPSRIAVCVLLREISTAGVMMDIARGQPVIHVNFTGYDEQAHRRGPDSYFAHWTLKGIDRAIGMIWGAAQRSSRSNYQVWIYSDHGQERTLAYPVLFGETVHEAVARIFEETDIPSGQTVDQYHDSAELSRAGLLGGKYFQKIFFEPALHPFHKKTGALVRVAAKGPLGHVYPATRLKPEEKEAYARRLVKEAGIPLVLYVDGSVGAVAATPAGIFRLPDDGARLFDERLPYFKELVADVVSLCHHDYAGDFVISGWRKDDIPVTFPNENGAHGGPGSRETHGVAIIPGSLARFFEKTSYLRASDLRQLALDRISRKARCRPIGGTSAGDVGSASAGKTGLRVMTYNLHGCQGMDGRVLPRRSAEVIAHYEPDVVCLQEVDSQRARSFYRQQPREIADYLGMNYVFRPAWQRRLRSYGNVILSRYPTRRVKSAALAGLSGYPHLERRSVLWVEIQVDNGQTYQILTTHVGLMKKEQQLQVHELLSEEWLRHQACSRRTIFCGDLNLPPDSFAHTLLSERFKDAQQNLPGHRPRPTWPGRYPLRILDYVFVSQDMTVQAVDVPSSALARIASDHLPLIVDVQPA